MEERQCAEQNNYNTCDQHGYNFPTFGHKPRVLSSNSPFWDRQALNIPKIMDHAEDNLTGKKTEK